jgi:hypothetical protein
MESKGKIRDLILVIFIQMCMITPCRIPGVFCRRKLLSRYRRTHGPHTYADCCLARRQLIRIVVYLRVLNRQRLAAPQLLFVDEKARALAWLATSNLLIKIAHCHCLHYCVYGIMSARSNSRSYRHDVSAM